MGPESRRMFPEFIPPTAIIPKEDVKASELKTALEIEIVSINTGRTRPASKGCRTGRRGSRREQAPRDLWICLWVGKEKYTAHWPKPRLKPPKPDEDASANAA